MYHTRVDNFRASYVALVINIKTSLFTSPAFFDVNFEWKYRPIILGLGLKCVWGKVFPSCSDNILTHKNPKPCILAHTTARWRKPALLPHVTCTPNPKWLFSLHPASLKDPQVKVQSTFQFWILVEWQTWAKRMRARRTTWHWWRRCQPPLEIAYVHFTNECPAIFVSCY